MLLKNSDVRFEDLTAVTVKFIVFWDGMLCGVTDVFQRFEVKFYLHFPG
jgi:hypothetical protein